jgi:hypothetical protein
MGQGLCLLMTILVMSPLFGELNPSNRVTVDVADPIVFTGQPPASQTKFVGEKVSITVTFTGAGNKTCQWRKDGVDQPGQTSATLSIESVAVGDAGSWRCFVQSDIGGFTGLSEPCQLTVYDGLGISQPPWSQTKDAGEDVGFTVVASGGIPPLLYQWQYSADDSAWSDLTGKTGSELDLGPLALSDAGWYRCCVHDSSDPALTACSQSAELTVLPAETPSPTFTLSHSSGSATYMIAFNAHGTALAGLLSSPGSLPGGTDFSNITGLGIYCRLADSPWTVLEVHDATVVQDGDTATLTFTGSGVDWGGSPTVMTVNGATFEANFYFRFSNIADRMFVNPDYVEVTVSGTTAAKIAGMYQIQF